MTEIRIEKKIYENENYSIVQTSQQSFAFWIVILEKSQFCNAKYASFFILYLYVAFSSSL